MSKAADRLRRIATDPAYNTGMVSREDLAETLDALDAWREFTHALQSGPGWLSKARKCRARLVELGEIER